MSQQPCKILTADTPGFGPASRPFRGGGLVTLSQLDDVAKLRGTEGWLVDMRMSDALYTSDTDTSVPITATGDLCGRMLNQCTASGSTGWFLRQANTADKPQWIEGYGLTATGGSMSSNENLSWTFQATGWDPKDGFSVVLAWRLSEATVSRVVEIYKMQANPLIMYMGGRVNNTGEHYDRSSFNSGATETAVQPNGDQVVVMTYQSRTDSETPASVNVDVYANNSLIRSAVAGYSGGNTLNFYLLNFRAENVLADQFMGHALIKGSLTADERQLFVDYFTQNGGVL